MNITNLGHNKFIQFRTKRITYLVMFLENFPKSSEIKLLKNE